MAFSGALFTIVATPPAVIIFGPMVRRWLDKRSKPTVTTSTERSIGPIGEPRMEIRTRSIGPLGKPEPPKPQAYWSNRR